MPKLPKKPKSEVPDETTVLSIADKIAEAPAVHVDDEPVAPDSAEAAPVLSVPPPSKKYIVTERKQLQYKGQFFHFVPGKVIDEAHYDKAFLLEVQRQGLKLKEQA